MNAALNKALANPWMASLISFLPIICFLFCLVLCQPRPLPTVEGLSSMPWWAPLGGLVGAFAGLTITANILMSLIIDKYGSILFTRAVFSINGFVNDGVGC
jgi:transporter family-2 protein